MASSALGHNNGPLLTFPLCGLLDKKAEGTPDFKHADQVRTFRTETDQAMVLLRIASKLRATLLTLDLCLLGFAGRPLNQLLSRLNLA